MQRMILLSMFSSLVTGKMPDKSNGDIAADGYHKYKVKTMT
jgi:hypothetical protein